MSDIHAHTAGHVISLMQSVVTICMGLVTAAHLKIKQQPIQSSVHREYNKDQIHEINEFQITNHHWIHVPVGTHT